MLSPSPRFLARIGGRRTIARRGSEPQALRRDCDATRRRRDKKFTIQSHTRRTDEPSELASTGHEPASEGELVENGLQDGRTRVEWSGVKGRTWEREGTNGVAKLAGWESGCAVERRKAPRDVTIQIKRAAKRHRPRDPDSIATQPISRRRAGRGAPGLSTVARLHRRRRRRHRRRILHYVLSLHKFISRRKHERGPAGRSHNGGLVESC